MDLVINQKPEKYFAVIGTGQSDPPTKSNSTKWLGKWQNLDFVPKVKIWSKSMSNYTLLAGNGEKVLYLGDIRLSNAIPRY